MKENMAKRLTAAVLSALLAVPAALPAAAAEGQTFTDVSPDQWFYPYVTYMSENQLTSGYPDGRYGVDDPVSVGAALVMVLRAAGCQEQVPGEGEHWAQGYADYAVAKGCLSQEQVEDLDAPMSRRTMAQLAARALLLKPSQAESPFADCDDGYVTALAQQGIVGGSQEDGLTVYRPESSITRAEISVIIMRINTVEVQAEQLYFGGRYWDVLDGVAVNDYDMDAFQTDERGRLSYTAAGMETRTGVDVSAFQGAIDWKAVAGDGIDFAMLRVGGRGYTEGNIYEDTYFEDNIQGALKAGLEVGVYFFSQAITEAEAREEAEYVLAALEGYEITYPVVFDWENVGSAEARTAGVDSDTLGRCANAFCQSVAKAGYTPMIYFNQSLGYTHYDLRQVADYSFWLAQHDSLPTFYYHFDLLQYTDQGTVAGIQGKVDLNLHFLPTEE